MRKKDPWRKMNPRRVEKGGKAMRYIKREIALLKRYGKLPVIILDIAITIVAAVTFALTLKPILLYTSSLFLVITIWEIDSVHHTVRADIYKALYENKCKESDDLEEMMKVLKDKLSSYETVQNSKKENPIKSNRIVSDRTFAVRLRNFISDIQVCDAISEEEKSYLLGVAERLIKWQAKTVRKTTDEYAYLVRLGICKNPSEERNDKAQVEVIKS